MEELFESEKYSKAYCNKYLLRYSIKERIYTTGLFQTGITVYRQQVRALNIFYAMCRTGKFNSKSKLCIIGGGIAGLTFAAAALKTGLTVYLLERESIFLHLQYGCDIREIYPHFHLWPDAKSRFPEAKLPVLNWHAGTASNVAKEITQSFEALSRSVGSKKFFPMTDVKTTPTITTVGNAFNVTAEGIVPESYLELKDGPEDSKPIFKDNKAGISFPANYIIYCTGFGIEIACEINKVTPSYWRNDEYGQTVLNKKDKFFLSGSGDGALTDLFRLKVLGFKYSSFFKFYYSLPNEQQLTEQLQKIKTEWLRHRDPEKLINSFKRLDLTKVKQYFKIRLRKHTDVILNSRPYYKNLVTLDKVNYINAFIFFVLYDLNNSSELKDSVFNYWRGKLEWDKTKNIYKVKTGRQAPKNPGKERVPIIRHGTSRKTVFNDTQISKRDVLGLKKKQMHKNFNQDIQLWSHRSFSKLFKHPVLSAYCANETISVCSSFAALVKSSIEHATKNTGEYRLNLLRVLDVDGNLHLQSVTPFHGRSGSTGIPGGILPFFEGPVVNTIKSGRPVIIRGKNGIALRDKLGVSRREITQKTRAILLIPILGHHPVSGRAINLVLYVAADEENFFSDHNMLLSIIVTCMGWVEYMNDWVGKHVQMDRAGFMPLSLSTRKTKRDRSIQFVDTRRGFNFLAPNRTPLCFDGYHSFDVFHNSLSAVEIETAFK